MIMQARSSCQTSSGPLGLPRVLTCAIHLLLYIFAFCLFFLVYAMVGLSRGGQQVGKCKEVFGKAVELLVQLASLQVSSSVSERCGLKKWEECARESLTVTTRMHSFHF